MKENAMLLVARSSGVKSRIRGVLIVKIIMIVVTKIEIIKIIKKLSVVNMSFFSFACGLGDSCSCCCSFLVFCFSSFLLIDRTLLHEFKGWSSPVTCMVQSPAVDVVAVGLAVCILLWMLLLLSD